MTPAKPTMLELAKQGNPKAIEALLNRNLQPKGITAKVALKDNCLQIMLESAQIPDQQILPALIHRGVASLGIASINRLKLYGRQLGSDLPSWNAEIELGGTNPLSSSIAPKKIISIPQTRANSSFSSLSSKSREKLPDSNRVTQVQAGYFSKFDLFKKPRNIIYITIVILFFGVVSLGSLKLFGSNPRKTAEAFLGALSEADEKTAMEHWCFQDGSKLFAVRDWKVIRQEDKKIELEVKGLSKYYPQIEEKLEKINGASYTEVVVRIDSSNQGGMPITNDWIFKIWRTKNLARYSDQADTIINIMDQNTPEDFSSLTFEQLSEQSDALIARGKFTEVVLHMVGESEDLTSKAYCITSLEEK